MKLKLKLIGRWHKIPENIRTHILDCLSIILNYLANGILLSVPIYIFLYLIFNLPFNTYFYLVISISILLSYIEHYYIFFKENWKKQA